MRVEIVSAGWMTSLEPDWRRLENCASSASIFQTYDWVKTWWKHFGDKKAPYLLIGKEGRDVVGIAPLCITKIFGLPRVQWMGTGASDSLQELVLPGYEEEFSESILEQIEKWRLVDLHEMSETAPFVAAAQKRGWSHLVQSRCPVIPLPPNLENASSLQKRLDRYLGYELDRAKRLFGKMVIEPASETNLDVYIEALFILHTKRWNERGSPGEFKNSRVRAFYREWARLCHERGWLRLYALTASEKVLAVLSVFHWRRHAYYYTGGFDTAAKRASPGNILTAYAIRSALEEGCSDFDFLRGTENYKLQWHPELKQHLRLCHGTGILGQLECRFISWKTDS